MGINGYPISRPVLTALAVFVAYLAIAGAALAMFRMRGVMPAGSELSLPRSVFTVANAASLSGFQQTIAVESYKPLGQAVILVLIIAASLASMIVGAAAVVRIVRLPYSMMQIVTAAIAVEIIAVAVGALALFGNGRSLFEAIFQAASAFGNCGIVIGPVTGVDSLMTHLLILPLSVFGGLGLPVLMELVDAMRRKRLLSTHARTVLAATAAIYLIGAGALILVNRPQPPSDSTTKSSQFHRVVTENSATTLNSRSLGWPSEQPQAWSRATPWVVMILMLIGASPAGSGGGLKVTTLVVLTRGTLASLRGSPVGRIFGIAIVWTAAYFLLIVLFTMSLSSSEVQLGADQVLFITVSAITNTGLSAGPISITGEGLYTLSYAMMVGRILPLIILWMTAFTVRDAEIAVG